MIPVNVGHEVDSSIGFLDASGNPMLVTPTPDSPPSWNNAPAPVGAAALTVSPDGLTSVDKAVAAGTDTLSVSLSVGGALFSATETITISAAPQVLTSIVINSVVN